MSGFRKYERNSTVEQTYIDIFENQHLEYVLKQIRHYKTSPSKIYNIFDLIDRLEAVVDESDPDTSDAQIYHAYQTAESITRRFFKNGVFLNPPVRMLFKIREWNSLPKRVREYYGNKRLKTLYPHITDWSWLPLVGLLHDLGKVLVFDEWGALPQWSVVGDTFPVGCRLSEAVIYKEHHDKNPDYERYGKFGIYTEKCGFDSLHMSWGHDEYLAMVLDKNIEVVKLPEEALYMIRYHSFYPWHTPCDKNRGYEYFADFTDWTRLPLLKILQMSDLYSKSTNLPDKNTLENYYRTLCDRWFLKTDLVW